MVMEGMEVLKMQKIILENGVFQEMQAVKEYDIVSGFSLLAKLNGHSDIVMGIALPSSSDKLYSENRDKTVCIWNYHTGQCVDAMDMSSKVCCLKSEGPWLFLGSKNVVKAWGIAKEGDHLEMINTYKEEHVLKLRRIENTQGKPIMLCLCNDNLVRLYD
ncbi:zinc finger CCCH domain-containing protein 63-like [Diospyros lotus]|uniref:zinc finger CCCH domain-containing protein 63-like n=1 Tax=Diospyros lotus TaxID=55363 RepID=UPI00225AC3FA|nr:zinc finger CCCH domain-containing protein 63-like [Diospyros lotus]